MPICHTALSASLFNKMFDCKIYLQPVMNVWNKINSIKQI